MKNIVLSAIAQRRSHRAYKPDVLSKAQLQLMMDAALASPSANNAQPWHFSVVQNQSLLKKINDVATAHALQKAAHQRSPRFDDPQFHIFYHAPVVIFLSAPTDRQIAWVDCGIAVNNLALAAHSLGLGSVILGLPREAFDSKHGPEIEKELHFPEGYGFVIAIAIGIPNDTKEAPERHPEKISYIY